MKQWYALYSQILYLHFSSGFYRLPESAKNAASPQSVLMRLLKMAGYTLVRLLGNLFKTVERPQVLQGKVWLYVVSQNNYDSLSFVQNSLPEAVFVAGQSKDIGKYNQLTARLSLRRKVLYYYKYLPLYFTFLKYKKQNTLRFFDVLYDAVGFYEVYRRKLQTFKPAAIVFANDHNPDARAMLLAAKSLGIKTLYVQHASVSAIFPPLAFDLNLLEGQDTLDKYKQCGPISGKVALIGMPKADAFVPYRNHNRIIRTVGLGCNLMDDVHMVAQLLQHLVSAFPDLQFILRPHPRDKRDFSFLPQLSPNISISNGTQEPVFEYLQKLDVQISGNSGIHLEAVLLNVWSVYYNFNPSEALHDYYGFVQHGLIEHAADASALVYMLKQHLTQKPDVYLRAQYYNATVGTPSDGKSGALAGQIIREFVGA